MAFTATQLPIEGTLPSLGGAIEWLNTQPLNMTQLHGKVVLIEFWTYTCINWRRTLPYVRAWADKYKDQGLVVIGVHTPEFGFEKNVANVRRAVKEIGITFPVAIDSDYVIWGAFKNPAPEDCLLPATLSELSEDVPRQQLCDAVDRMVGDAFEYRLPTRRAPEL